MMTFPDPKLLLHPSIPRPLHGLNPRTLLGQEWWDKERRKAYRKHNYHCHACGVHTKNAKYYTRLKGHEQYDIDFNKSHATYIGAVALCHACHNYIHLGLLEIQVKKRKASRKKLFDIRDHGNRLLDQNDLRRPIQQEIQKGSWSRWRLQIGDQLFKPLHKTHDAWKRHYCKSRYPKKPKRHVHRHARRKRKG